MGGCVLLNVQAYIFKCYLNVDESQIRNFTVNPAVSCSLIRLSFSLIVLELLAWCVAIKDECVAGEMALAAESVYCIGREARFSAPTLVSSQQTGNPVPWDLMPTVHKGIMYICTCM